MPLVCHLSPSRKTCYLKHLLLTKNQLENRQRETETERKTERKSVRQKDTGRETERKIDRQIDRHIEGVDLTITVDTGLFHRYMVVNTFRLLYSMTEKQIAQLSASEGP